MVVLEREGLVGDEEVLRGTVDGGEEEDEGGGEEEGGG